MRWNVSNVGYWLTEIPQGFPYRFQQVFFSTLQTPIEKLTDSISGGPAGLVYGFLFVWVGVLCVFTTLSELVSMYTSVLAAAPDHR